MIQKSKLLKNIQQNVLQKSNLYNRLIFITVFNDDCPKMTKLGNATLANLKLANVKFTYQFRN